MAVAFPQKNVKPKLNSFKDLYDRTTPENRAMTLDYILNVKV